MAEERTIASQVPVESQLRAALGPGSLWHTDQGATATVWPLQNFDVLWAPDAARDSDLRSVWRARSGGGAQPVLTIAPSPQIDRVRVLGPQDPQAPIRNLPLTILLQLVQETRSLPRRQAAAILASEFLRLDESPIPGLGGLRLLTPHFLRDRLRRPENWMFLTQQVAAVNTDRGWQENLRALGYRIEQTKTGYLLRHGQEPVAVLHAYPDASMFSRATEQGSLPEGLVLAECERTGAAWGILATPRRCRLFRTSPPVGAASGRYLEIDLRELGADNKPYVGLLSPESIKKRGRLEEWIAESLRFGEQLRDDIDQRLRHEALPNIARGLGEFLESKEGAELGHPDVLREIEAAALTLVFRIIFVLYAEAAGFLPVDSNAYRPHGATELAAAARRDLGRLDKRSGKFWDRLTALVHMVRTGDRATGVSAYNGSLFAASGFPGSDLLERSQIRDIYLAPALSAIAHVKDDPESPGLDYAELEIGHLGAIYEGLLGLKLTSAREALRYDERTDRYLPARAGDPLAVHKAQLFYQTQTGGRKAEGIYYTRQEFVSHLIKHSLEPAFDSHLTRISQVAAQDPAKAAHELFDFNVVDPAMGSAHFLTTALDVMADRIEHFLADNPLPTVRELLDSLKADSDGGAGRVYEDSQLLRRLILKRCIYGVDLSQMAVEVANISLWLASFVPGLALSYLGSNLKVGDALIGVADMAALRNISPMFSADYANSPLARALEPAKEAARALAEVTDRTPDEVLVSQQKDKELKVALEGIARCLNLWCAEPLGIAGARHVLETGDIEAVIDGTPLGQSTRLVEAANQEAERRHFFHWPLAFPLIFLRDRPGFDVVIGNPPWNEVNIEELGFYALHDPGLRGVIDERDRRTRIQELDRLYPHLRQEFERRYQELVTQRRFFGAAGGYQLQGKGNLDVYELFCERYGHLARDKGWLGVVLPRSAFLGEGARGFRRWLFKDCTPSRVDFLLNAGRWAFNMEPRYTISLLSAQRVSPESDANMHQTGPSASLDAFLRASRSPGVVVSLQQLRSWTPSPSDDRSRESSWEVPLLPSQAAAELFTKLCRAPRFDQGFSNLWRAFPVQGDMNETSDKKMFSHKQGVPVWKGRCFDQYDPHGEDPAGYAEPRDLERHLQQKRQSSRSQFRRHFLPQALKTTGTLPLHHARIAFRDVSRATDSRTIRSCLIPPDTGLTNTAPYLVFPMGSPLAQGFVLGVFNSVPFDWQARRFVETHANFFILNMLCFPPPEETPWEEIGRLAARLSCVDDRFAEFARQAGVDCGPLKEDRFDLQIEIDALVSHAYGLDEADLYTIFKDFTENAVPPAYRERLVTRFREVRQW